MNDVVKKSPIDNDLSEGKTKVGKEERKVKKGIRKTDEGKKK